MSRLAPSLRAPFPAYRLAAIALAGAVLAGCASLSEDECRAGDWRGIGFTDGAAGRGPDFIENHRKACAKVGISPDLSEWLAGRERGLRQYCTPQSAYRVARSGRSLSPVCTSDEMSRMRDAQFAGRQYYDIGQEITALQSDLSEVALTLDTLPDDAGAERRRLRRERDRLEDRISRLDRDRRRYDSWPG